MLVSLKSIEVFFAKLHYAIIAPGRRLLAPILHADWCIVHRVEANQECPAWHISIVGGTLVKHLTMEKADIARVQLHKYWLASSGQRRINTLRRRAALAPGFYFEVYNA